MMKTTSRLPFAIALLALLSLCAPLPSWGQVAPVEGTDVQPQLPPTEVDIPLMSHDFGEIPEGVVVTKDFYFHNVGQNPLQIENVKPSCGCTTPKWSDEPIAPGAEGFVTVQFDSRGKRGMQKKSVTLTFANTDPKNYILTFNAEVVLDEDATDTLGSNGSTNGEIRVLPLGDDEAMNSNIDSLAALSLSQSEAKAATLDSLLALMLAQSKEEPDPTVARPVAPELTTVQFEKDDHDFGDIAEGTRVTYRYVFKNTGKKPLVIDHVKPSCGCTTPDWSKEPVKRGKKGFVEIEFDSMGKNGIQKKSVTVTFANTDPKNVVLSFQGKVVPKD